MKRCLAFLIIAGCLLMAASAFAESWMDSGKYGQVVYHNDIPHYVDEKGTVSVNIEGSDVIWLKESSEGQTAWIGLDNRNQTFKDGSRFHVQWLSKQEEEWGINYRNLDESIKNQPIDRMWMFELGVAGPDGEEMSELEEDFSLYIQLGDNWDIDDLHACYIAQGTDERFVVDTVQLDEAGITGTFGVLSVKHFSPYAIFDFGVSPVVQQPPRTGDHANMILWAALAGMSLVGMFMMSYRWKKG